MSDSSLDLKLTPTQGKQFDAIMAVVDDHFTLFDSAMQVATADRELTIPELAHICNQAQSAIRGIFVNITVKVLPHIPTDGYAGYNLQVWWKGNVTKQAQYSYRLSDYGIGEA